MWPKCMQILASLHREDHFVETLMRDRLLLDRDDKFYRLDFTYCKAVTLTVPLPIPYLQD